MRYWWRELGGWLLVAVGLLFGGLAYELCDRRRMLEAWPVALTGIVIFWGGIHLLKVAMAARICQQAQDRLYPAGTSPKKRGP